MLDIKIDLIETSQSIEFENAKNAYSKGPFYCVYIEGKVHKFPLANIWRVVETYGVSASQ